jgi:hypothetical protein
MLRHVLATIFTALANTTALINYGDHPIAEIYSALRMHSITDKQPIQHIIDEFDRMATNDTEKPPKQAATPS